MSAWHWYTKARRIPTLIGKDAAGRRIPGGPYTALQAIAALVTPAVTWCTRALWAGHLTGLATLIAVLAVSFGVVKLLGKVDFASRNPLLLTGSYLRQILSPPGGTLAGTPLRPAKKHRVRSGVVVGQLIDTPALAAVVAVAATEQQPTVPTAPATERIAPAAEPAPSRRPANTKTASTKTSSTKTVSVSRGSDAGAADSGTTRAARRPVATNNSPQPQPVSPTRPVSPGRRSGLETFLSSTEQEEPA